MILFLPLLTNPSSLYLPILSFKAVIHDFLLLFINLRLRFAILFSFINPFKTAIRDFSYFLFLESR